MIQNISIIGDYRNCKTNITCKCNKCGRIWSATPTNLLKGKGCPSCAQSIGERRISSWLKAHNIEFSQEHRFDDCCYQRPLPFDFYVPSLNTCIEYDGQQHYYPVCFGGQAQDDAEKYFELCQTRDSIKNDYCKKNHINLLRIPYSILNIIGRNQRLCRHVVKQFSRRRRQKPSRPYR